MEYKRFALVTNPHLQISTEICEYLLSRDFIVFGTGKEECQIYHGYFYDILTDFSNEQSVENMFATIQEHTTDLAIIINVQDKIPTAPIEDISTNEFKNTILNSVVGQFHLLKHSKHLLFESNGIFINILNSLAKDPIPNYATPCTVHRSLKTLTDTCREEWSNSNMKFCDLILDGYPEENNEYKNMEGLLSSIDAIISVPNSVDLSQLKIKENPYEQNWT
jgi:NAD(P)-dependent dehydrogenase (short-subunit alcohol dehydrogenase family)